jgi:hypothetical protein|tara:strand:+ start:2006 stop:2320 length:315 start_codon:yes stop_codon:yes gene_type:complete
MSNKKEKKNTFISELKKERRVNEDVLNVISDLTLEELISIKLELSAKMFNGKLYNFSLWHSLPYIVRESLLNFVNRNCKTKIDMSNTLGIPYEQFIQIYKKYIN